MFIHALHRTTIFYNYSAKDHIWVNQLQQLEPFYTRIMTEGEATAYSSFGSESDGDSDPILYIIQKSLAKAAKQCQTFM